MQHKPNSVTCNNKFIYGPYKRTIQDSSIFIICTPLYTGRKVLWSSVCVCMSVCPEDNSRICWWMQTKVGRRGKLWCWSNSGYGSRITFPLSLTLWDRAFMVLISSIYHIVIGVLLAAAACKFAPPSQTHCNWRQQPLLLTITRPVIILLLL